MTTGQIGLLLLAGFVTLLLYCLIKRQEAITLQQFCHEIWYANPMARWQWWLLLMIIIWKL